MKARQRLHTSAVTDVSELVRYSVPDRYDKVMPDGEYVLLSQAAEIITAKDAEIERWKDCYVDANGHAEAAEAKLAQYETQKPAMWLCIHDDIGPDRAIITSFPSRSDILRVEGYEITPLYFSPLAPEGGKD